jgi:hypothetical protein
MIIPLWTCDCSMPERRDILSKQTLAGPGYPAAVQNPGTTVQCGQASALLLRRLLVASCICDVHPSRCRRVLVKVYADGRYQCSFRSKTNVLCTDRQ